MAKGKTQKIQSIRGTLEIFTVPEAAEYLRESERLLRDQLKDPVHPLPHYRIGNAGRLIRIRKSDIDNWLEHYRVTFEINLDAIVDELMN